jgi:hypothetical protein
MRPRAHADAHAHIDAHERHRQRQRHTPDTHRYLPNGRTRLFATTVAVALAHAIARTRTAADHTRPSPPLLPANAHTCEPFVHEFPSDVLRAYTALRVLWCPST